MKFIQVITTVSNKEDAKKIANTLVEKKLAGCVQIIGPITSIFRWKEKIEEAEEYMCIVKTREDRYEDVEKAIKEAHPYDVPEILSVQVNDGNKSYLDWLDKCIDKE